MPDDLNAESLLFSAILETGEMGPVLEAGISEANFTAHPDGWAFLASYWQEYGETPSAPLFRARFKHITTSRVKDLHYAIANLKAQSRDKELSKGIREAHAALRSGDFENATRTLQQHLRQAGEVVNDGATINLQEVADDLLKTVMERHEQAQKGIVPGVPTGWDSVDTRTGGVQDGHLWVLGARLGQGKTWFLTNMASEAVKNGKTVLFVSLEMPYREVAYRAHSLIARSFGYNVKSFSLSSGQGVDLMDYRQFLIDMPDIVPGQFIVNDTRRGRVTPLTLGAQIERVEPDIVFVDYLTLMGSSEGKRASDDWRVAASISSDVKEVAQRCEVPIVAAAQLNRTAAGGTKHPGTDTLSQSDTIGMDADAVMTMAQFGGPQVRKVEMVKYRHGPDGWSFFSRFDPDGEGFDELTRDDVDDLLEDIRDDDEEFKFGH